MEISGNILIIRHSIREPITNAMDSYRQRLTSEGFDLAKQLGKKIAFYSNNFNLFYSPIPRCEETAIAIIQGIENEKSINSNIQPLEILGGFFYRNWEYCAKLMNEQTFTKKWFDNEIPHENILPITETANKMLSEIKQNSKNNCLNIFITHDWNLFCIKTLFFDKYENVEVPKFLEGISINQEKNVIQIIKQEHYKS